MNEVQTEQQIADRICRDLVYGGRTFAIGDCVAILDGEIVAVTTTLDDALNRLRAVDPNPNRGLLLEVGPLVDVIRTAI